MVEKKNVPTEITPPELSDEWLCFDKCFWAISVSRPW
jgi:hypothetical protein